MPLTQWLLTLITYAVLLLLLWQGRRPDRWAALVLLAAQNATPLIVNVELAGVRIGLALASLCLSVALTWLALIGRRWWLLAAAGVQLIALASWIYQLLDPGAQLWAAVTFRMIVWAELMALALFGVFEARLAPYAPRSPERS